MRVVPYSNINRNQWTAVKYKAFATDLMDAKQTEQTAPLTDDTDFYRIWQTFQMKSALRWQQV